MQAYAGFGHSYHTSGSHQMLSSLVVDRFAYTVYSDAFSGGGTLHIY